MDDLKELYLDGVNRIADAERTFAVATQRLAAVEKDMEDAAGMFQEQHTTMQLLSARVAERYNLLAGRLDAMIAAVSEIRGRLDRAAEAVREINERLDKLEES